MNHWTRTLALAALYTVAGVPGTACGELIDVQTPDVVVMIDGVSAVADSLIVGLAGTGAEQMGGYTVSIDVVAQAGATDSVTLTGAGTFDIIADRTDAGTVSAVTGDLFELSFLVAPCTESVFDVDVLFALATLSGSEVQDWAGLPIAKDFTGDSITVMIPEPATSVVFFGAALTLLIRRGRVF
jgi:hypothetical protein